MNRSISLITHLNYGLPLSSMSKILFPPCYRYLKRSASKNVKVAQQNA